MPLAAIVLVVLSGPTGAHAALPMSLLLVAMRKGALTDLRLTGMVAGLTAGAISVIGFALYCPLDGMGMILFWYLAALALCAGVGALVGPLAMAW